MTIVVVDTSENQFDSLKARIGVTPRTAAGLIAWYMKLCGFKGWTSFWRVIYVLPGYENNERLLRHEMKHLEQIERDGRLLFTVKYLWWLCRYGYLMNPYEVEARAAADQTTTEK